MNRLKDLPAKILRNAWIIIALVAGFAAARFLFPGEKVYVGKPYPVKDSAGVAQAVERAIELRSDSVAGFWERFWKLKLRPIATGYYAMPSIDPYPPRELRLSSKDSNIISGVAVPAIDAPISVEADRSDITITTRNEWLRSRGEPFVKVYQYPRLAPDFSFALNETTSPDRLDGINFYFKKRAVEFEGFGLLAGASYPKIFYGGVDARFIFWEKVELTPRLLSTPELSVEVRWRF